jgi:4-hydroxy-tetrahydrodipicolinate synthase
MRRHPDFVPQGVIPAVLLPFHEDLAIDEASFRSHLRDVGSVRGLSAITINAHSTEVASCSADEQRRVMEITAEEVGDTLPIIHGVWADGGRRPVGLRRCWCFRRVPSRSANPPKWRWPISRPSRTRPICH